MLLTAVVDAREVRVAEGRRAHDVVTEGAADRLVRGEVREEDLDDDVALEGDVLGQVDLGGAPDTEETRDSVSPRQRVVGSEGGRHSLNHT